ncbi:MAG: DEAD/DEAH box helicase [Candidatus Gracilibacteria bacterium]|jgi:ATP-dependent RNA helicase DeaD|nr:DEAD/DEAH box helicase [Candidatus Gracilibacteria bacterium]
MSFKNLGLKESLLKSIENMGFKEPSPIQKQAIPVILKGRDIIAQAHTGTGKTAAFGLPCLNQINGKKGVEILIITPTRELANQVSDELFAFGKNDELRTVTVFGGQSYKQQIDRVKRGAQVVVATPGRLLDLLKGKRIGDFAPSMVILDEADEMLDMGFLDDIKEVFTYLPKERQTLMFSATMPKPIRDLANSILKNPETVNVTKSDDSTINKDIEELYCVIDEKERDDAIVRLMDSESPEKAVIFCRTKSEVDRISTMLMGRGHLAKGLHGDMEQKQRESVMRSFQNGSVAVLVATDVAARGIDVKGITHVFNFHIPFEPESYVHRIGRTARAGEKGIAITLVSPREWRDLKRIKQKIGSQMTHRAIPTIEDLKKENAKKLMAELENQEINESAGLFFALLVDEMGFEQAAQKLMSYILESDEVTGPESIGVKGEQLKRFFFDIEKKGDVGKGGGSRSRGGFRRRRSSGGSRASHDKKGRGYKSESKDKFSSRRRKKKG